MKYRIYIKIPFLLLCVWLILGIAQPAFGAVLWHGKFRLDSANPWKIQIIESYGPGLQKVTPTWLLRSDKTGLPFVTEDHWICVGRLPTESDMGQVYEFIGVVPDIGGSYSFWPKPLDTSRDPGIISNNQGVPSNKQTENSLKFRSKWVQPLDERLLALRGPRLLQGSFWLKKMPLLLIGVTAFFTMIAVYLIFRRIGKFIKKT